MTHPRYDAAVTFIPPNSGSPESHDMERYQREKTLSIYWANRANDLRGAAGAVWFAIENGGKTDQIHKFLGMEDWYAFSAGCPSVFLMLCGLSLELLFKALILELREKPPASHDLRVLCGLAQITMSADDLQLVDLLTDHTKWAGRYPVPLGNRTEWDQHYDRMTAALSDSIDSQGIKIRRWNDRLDWKDYSRIWEIVSVRYWELHRQQYP